MFHHCADTVTFQGSSKHTHTMGEGEEPVAVPTEEGGPEEEVVVVEEEEVKEKEPLVVEILPVIKEAQQQHGLRHGVYTIFIRITKTGWRD